MDSGETIFYTFLERFPEHQQKFVAFRDKPLAELKVRSPPIEFLSDHVIQFREQRLSELMHREF